MTINNHPDFQQESDNLDFTKKYMKIVIQASESNEETFRTQLKESLEGIDLKDSSFSYMSMLTNSNLLRRTEEEVRKLKRIMDKPYFARVDFCSDLNKLDETFYFGKASLFDKETQAPIIVDWRSPIANLYYDGRLGNVSYKAEGEEYSGFLSLKRQYIIEKGELLEIRDIDLTTRDELLQKSLAESASNRLTDIVSTIQEEQNNIIRADLNKPIIVQGAAGSGKTTIALHRISYFIYTYADYFSPEQLMILAPNRLFIDYISEVLPELGVENILQTTFLDYVQSCINKKIKLISPEEKLIKFINRKIDEPDKVRWISAFKGSLQYRDMIKCYLEDILHSLLPKEDFYLGKFRLYHAQKLHHLMMEDYSYLSYYQRIEKIKRVLQSHVRTEKKNLIKKITEFYDQKIERALYSRVEPEKRRSYVSKALDKKQEALNEVMKESRRAVNMYIKKIPKHPIFYYYQDFMLSKEKLKKYSNGILTNEQIDYFIQYHRSLVEKKSYEVEDLAALLYLQSQLFGIKKEWKVKNVVIDEAQDYSYFQLFALKNALESDMFTIVGDLAQGIHSYRGINNWDIVQQEIFPRAVYKTLQKSYRTTIEIMNVANGILSLLQLGLPTVEPVVRHGKKPLFRLINNSEVELAKALSNQIEQLYDDGMNTIAVIGKTTQECMELAHIFTRHTHIPVQVLKENEEINREKVVVVSAHLSKGLEFDAVIICSYNEVFEENEIDIKLLYVAMTRPLHELVFFGNEPACLLLHHINYQLINFCS